MQWIINDIIRLDPVDSEFEVLDQLDEQQILDGDGSRCHILHDKDNGDLVSVSYFGYIDIAEKCKVEKLEVSGNNGTALVKIHNPLTGWTGYGASQAEIQNVAEEKAYRNAIRLSLRPSVFRGYSKRWLVYWVHSRYVDMSNIELSQAMYRKDLPFQSASRLFHKAKLQRLSNWQIRYILLREVLFGEFAVSKPESLTARYNRYKSLW